MAAVDASRETLARLIGADFREVIFTGSATEANNLALRGAVRAWCAEEKHAGVQPRIIISTIEHESVLETAHDLERDGGAEIVYLPVNRLGVVDRSALRAALNERTVVVSVMYANNEIGTIQPLAEIAALIANFKKTAKAARYPLFHTDAVQAFQFLDCNVAALGVDMMTLSAHKIYGPKGIGLLYAKNATAAKPSFIEGEIAGGGQEFGLRSGTENVPLIVGFAKAAELAAAVRKKETKRTLALKEVILKKIKKRFPTAEVNGSQSADADISTSETLPNILNVYFPGHAAEDMVMKLDLAGVAISAGSACRSRALGPSYVVEALGHSKERARSSLRFSLGRQTTKAEAVKLFRRLSGI
jgi:cysteine desulfurase